MQSFPNVGPFEPESFIGPLINRRQYDRVLDYIRSGVTEGATLVTGGGRVLRLQLPLVLKIPGQVPAGLVEECPRRGPACLRSSRRSC